MTAPHYFLALGGGFLSMALMYLLFAVSGDFGRLSSLLILGVDATRLQPWPLPFTLGGVAWLLFMIGLLELLAGIQRVTLSRTILRRRLLPEDPSTVLTPNDAGQLLKSLRLALREQEHSWFYRLVQRLIYQFQSTHRVDICQNQLQLNLQLFSQELAAHYRLIHTLIAMLGTLAVGIALSGVLWGIHGELAAQPFAQQLKLALGSGAWLWFLAWLLALGGQQLHAQEQQLLNQTSQYCLDHLLNCFYYEDRSS